MKPQIPTFPTVFLTQAIFREGPPSYVCRSEAEELTPLSALFRAEKIIQNGVSDVKKYPDIVGYYCGIEVDEQIVWARIASTR